MSLKCVTIREETVVPQSNEHARADPAIHKQRTNNNAAPVWQRLGKMFPTRPTLSSPYSSHRRSALTAAFHEAATVKLSDLKIPLATLQVQQCKNTKPNVTTATGRSPHPCASPQRSPNTRFPRNLPRNGQVPPFVPRADRNDPQTLQQLAS